MKKLRTHNTTCLPPHLRTKKKPISIAVSRTKSNKDKLAFMKKFGEVIR